MSGGIDSTALLAALAARRAKKLRLRAAHVDHGLHPNSSQWSEHCRDLARTLHVPLEILTTKVVRARGVSLEAAARARRYALLAQILEPGEFLLTAHHEDDQLETVLLQLFRGAGLAGLAAMPDIAPFASGWLARPLLPRPRRELEAWVRGAGLSWIEDDSNQDESLDRSYLRKRVLPPIRERWKGVGAAVSRSARHAAQGQRLLDMLARADVERAANGTALSVQTLRALSWDRRCNALRFWIDRAGARAPDSRRLEELAGPVIAARPDAKPRVAWPGAEVHRHADMLSIRVTADLAAMDGGRLDVLAGRSGAGAGRSAADIGRSGAGGERPDSGHEEGSGIEWAWRESPALELPWSRAILELRRDPHGPIDLERLPDLLHVRRRTGGERIRPRHTGPRRALKSLLQESQLPIAERAALPLIFADGRLIAAGPLWVDASVQAATGAPSRARLMHIAPRS